ncbi:MAG: hypothetical protein LBN24_11295 [Mediterranea sp.]|jgi:hypothetical protein|nr:hypothetical protein [Mediterranea sp.]
MKQIKYFAMCVAAVTMAACSNDALAPDDNGLQGGEQSNEVANFEVKITGVNPLSRVPLQTTEESNITKLEFFIFNNDGTQDQLTPYAIFDENQILTAKGKYNLQALEGDKQVIVVANSNLGKLDVGKTMSDLETMFSTFKLDVTNNDPKNIPDEGLEMSGKSAEFALTKGLTTAVSVNLIRLTSKIVAPQVAQPLTVVISDDDSKAVFGNTPDQGSAITFTYKGYTFINGAINSHVWMDGQFENWTHKGYTDTHTWYPSSFNQDGDYTEVYSGEDKPNNTFFLTTQSVYVHENQPNSATDNANISGFVAKQVYSYIIKGTLTAKINGADEVKTRYWRVNLQKDNDYRILRNKFYQLTLTNVVSAGFLTPKEAEEAPGEIIPSKDNSSILFTLNVVDWDQINEDTEM